MLAVPRLLVYQCMVAIPGCLYVVARMQRKGLVFLSLAMLLLLSTQEIHNSLPVVKYLVCDFYRFAPTFALLLVLLTWLYEPLHMNTAFGGRAFTRDTCDECQQSAALVREARSGPRAGEP